MIKSTKIKIGKKNYIFKAHSYRALFMFEDMTGKKIDEMKTLEEQCIFIYCIFKTSNKDFEYELTEFIDVLEEEGHNISNFFQKIDSEKK